MDSKKKAIIIVAVIIVMIAAVFTAQALEDRRNGETDDSTPVLDGDSESNGTENEAGNVTAYVADVTSSIIPTEFGSIYGLC